MKLKVSILKWQGRYTCQTYNNNNNNNNKKNFKIWEIQKKKKKDIEREGERMIKNDYLID
jgi:hypothetical protein